MMCKKTVFYANNTETTMLKINQVLCRHPYNFCCNKNDEHHLNMDQFEENSKFIIKNLILNLVQIFNIRDVLSFFLMADSISQP